MYGKNKSSICETVKKEKEINASFAVTSWTAKVMDTIHDKGLVKMEKALNLYNKIFWEREPLSDNFYYSIIVLFYYCS